LNAEQEGRELDDDQILGQHIAQASKEWPAKSKESSPVSPSEVVSPRLSTVVSSVVFKDRSSELRRLKSSRAGIGLRAIWRGRIGVCRVLAAFLNGVTYPLVRVVRAVHMRLLAFELLGCRFAVFGEDVLPWPFVVSPTSLGWVPSSRRASSFLGRLFGKLELFNLRSECEDLSLLLSGCVPLLD
jgi:hypothetical protein